ncbi:hypothetical protein [Gordonia insulae]|uniref:Uncharacterized protein n=1 Tax=Gordonia insulae TaxID=2420509 RepID=A0A3G8JG94_9ACTN|nr:hypothetical protein [Gordonia insulae]AZG43459.1 hypothetical protein D7316_00023 [Gordonia insulae]
MLLYALLMPLRLAVVTAGWLRSTRARRSRQHQAWVDAWDAAWSHA